MQTNRLRISFAREDINATTTNVDANGFVPLANVPDEVWKQSRTAEFPAGRRGRENPTHYADMDEEDGAGRTLFGEIQAPGDLTVEAFQRYYDGLGHTEPRSRGLLPLRVWQFYRDMVAYVRDGDVARFVCAAGILSHYVGDACQVLHGSYLADGDPKRMREREIRRRDGTIDTVTEPFGKGVHSAYESRMLNAHVDELMEAISERIGDGGHGMGRVSGGQEAAFAVVELMKRVRQGVHPMDVVNTFGNAKEAGENATEALWEAYHSETADAIVDGSRVLAMLWESAWVEGQGQNIPQDRLRVVSAKRLKELHSTQDFVESVSLDEVGKKL